MNDNSLQDLTAALKDMATDMDSILGKLMPVDADVEHRVVDAMRYASLDGGKRLRPFLLMQTAALYKVSPHAALRAAAAVEMIHCYSLVHDDLPAMDDDDLRRGRPTVHKAFDEATAILTGDALQSLAFEVLADSETHDDPTIRCELVRLLAQASGVHGMVGGQMIDLEAEEKDLNLGEITRLQQFKTGALIAASCEMGAVMGHASKADKIAIRAYARDLGLAFQIADDLLDVESDEETLGKKVQKDTARGKATFVSLLGLEKARQQAHILTDQAIAHLQHFGADTHLLEDAARFAVLRKN